MLPSGPRLSRRSGCASRLWAFLLPFAALGAEAPNIAGTMPEDYLPELRSILQTARQQAPVTIAANIEIALNEARVYGADAARLPNLSANFSYNVSQTAISGDQATNNRDHGLFYSVSLTQNLFTWGALKNQSAIADINVRIAQRSYDSAYRMLAQNLRQIYLSLIAKKAALVQARYSLGVVEANFPIEQEKLARGLVARNQVLLREVARNEARMQVARLEAEFVGDRRRFSRLAGIDLITENAIPAEIPAPIVSVANGNAIADAVARDGGRTTLEAQIADLRIQQADRQLAIENVRQRPKISASAGTSLTNATTATPNTVTQQGVTTQSVSVNAQWNIFDGLATKGAKLEAGATKRQQERRLAAVTEETIDSTQALAGQLALDLEALRLSETRREIAAATAQQAAAEFERGQLAKASVTDAESALLLATANRLMARAMVLSRWSELVSTAGMDPLNANPRDGRD